MERFVRCAGWDDRSCGFHLIVVDRRETTPPFLVQENSLSGRPLSLPLAKALLLKPEQGKYRLEVGLLKPVKWKHRLEVSLF